MPVAFGLDKEESYASIKNILDRIKYNEHKWTLCSDFKVVTFLMGLKKGNTKYPCHLCLWDSRYGPQYDQKVWPIRDPADRNAKYNVVADTLVPAEKVLLPPLHIKLGLFKNYLKFMQRRNPNARQFLVDFFPTLSASKLAEGIYVQFIRTDKKLSYMYLISVGVLVGPDIRRLMASENFELVLDESELIAWKGLKKVTTEFLGKKRSTNYEISVQEMLDAFKVINIHMSTKIHFMNSHLDVFARQLPTESDEQGERFHQVCKPFESNYRGKDILALVTDLCWQLADSEAQTSTGETPSKRKPSQSV